MGTWKRAAWIAAGVALAAALGWAFRPRPVPVEVAGVTEGPFAQAVEEDGATRVRERYVVSAPPAGRLSQCGLIATPRAPCPAAPSATCSASPISANPTARRSAA